MDKDEKEFEVIKLHFALKRLLISGFIAGGLVGLYGFYENFSNSAVAIFLFIIGAILFGTGVYGAHLYNQGLEIIIEKHGLEYKLKKSKKKNGES